MAEQLNDVNLEGMKAADKAFRENPALARRTVKVRSSWLKGTKTMIEIGEQVADGRRVTPTTRKFVVTADAPPGLAGVDAGPSAPELLMAALAHCVTAGIATNAAMFDVPIDGLDIEMDGDIDLRGVFGHDKSVRNGFSDIRYTVTIHSPAPEEKVRRCKETIDRKSPVLDTLVKPVNVSSTFVHKPS
ncbi:MAG: OsmC family protein [Candidatus Rokubacteria bacterium]|nr:OsmC family protein [Candidatus Rokubacteria bacterium]